MLKITSLENLIKLIKLQKWNDKMKKIGILTWLHNGNYGTVLQAYALNIFLTSKGYDVSNINYNLSTKNKIINLLKQHNSFDLIKEKMEYRKYYKEHSNELDIKKSKFEDFLCFFKHTNLISNNKDLCKYSNQFDYYICGSDQIWSPRLFNPMFFLKFVDSKKIKLSYACSFGSINTTKRKNSKIVELLKDFKYISVREEKGKNFLSSLGVDSNIDVDPTLLLKYDDWNKLISPVKSKRNVFAYFLSYQKKYIDMIINYCEINDLKLTIICNFNNHINANDNVKIIYDAGPIDWLNYINSSEMVFTDSYHGMILSLILKTNVRVFKRFKDGGKNDQNSRIYHIINLLDLSNILVDDSIVKFDLNFDKISQLIDNYAENSKNNLLGVLE